MEPFDLTLPSGVFANQLFFRTTGAGAGLNGAASLLLPSLVACSAAVAAAAAAVEFDLLDRVMKDLARCIMLAAFVKGDSEWVASFTLLPPPPPPPGEGSTANASSVAPYDFGVKGGFREGVFRENHDPRFFNGVAPNGDGASIGRDAPLPMPLPVVAAAVDAFASSLYLEKNPEDSVLGDRVALFEVLARCSAAA